MSRSSLALILLLPGLLVIAGCAPAASSGSSSANAPTSTRAAATSTLAPTQAPPPTPTQTAPTAECPQLPAASGQAPSAPLSLYVITSDNALAALNASDGSQRWKDQIAPNGSLVDTVAVEQNVIYVAVQDGTIEALNASTGALRWCTLADPTGPVNPTLVVDQNGVYVAGQGTLIVALNPSNGSQLWKAQAEAGVLSMSVADGQLYVSSEGATSGDTLSSFNTSDGKEQWHLQTGNSAFTQPTVANGVVYVAESASTGNSPGFLYAFNASDGGLRWHVQESQGVGFEAPVVANGVVYVVDPQAGVYAFDASTGASRWSVSHPSLSNLGPVVDTSGLYFASIDGNSGQNVIYALNLTDGSLRWQTQPTAFLRAARIPLTSASSDSGFTVLAATNGMVYVTSISATAVLNASNGKQQWSAPGTAMAAG